MNFVGHSFHESLSELEGLDPTHFHQPHKISFPLTYKFSTKTGELLSTEEKIIDGEPVLGEGRLMEQADRILCHSKHEFQFNMVSCNVYGLDRKNDLVPVLCFMNKKVDSPPGES